MPRVPFLALLALLLPFCMAPASVPHEEYEIKPAGIEGTWKVTSWKEGGKDVFLPGELVGRQMIVTRVRLTLNGDDVLYKLDLGRDPPSIDLFDDDSKSGAYGIYQVRGNQLTLCWTQTGRRPTAFFSKPGTDLTLV